MTDEEFDRQFAELVERSSRRDRSRISPSVEVEDCCSYACDVSYREVPQSQPVEWDVYGDAGWQFE